MQKYGIFNKIVLTYMGKRYKLLFVIMVTILRVARGPLLNLCYGKFGIFHNKLTGLLQEEMNVSERRL